MHKITNEANIRYLRIHTDHPSVEVRLVAGRISTGHPEMHDDFTSSSSSSSRNEAIVSVHDRQHLGSLPLPLLLLSLD